MQCVSIRRVAFVNCKTPLGWLRGVKWPLLEHLSLTHSVMTSHFEIQAILESKDWHKTLKSLNLTGCYRVKAFDHDVKTDLSLERFDLSGTNINDSLLESMAKLPLLKELHLRNCSGLTDKGLLKIPSCYPNLNVLDVSDITMSASTKDHLLQTMFDTNIKF